MRPILTWSIVVVVVLVLAAVWLSAGRRISLLLDHVGTVSMASLPTTPVSSDGGGFRLGETSLTFIGTDNETPGAKVRADGNRAVLDTGSQTFTLGPLTRPPDPAGRPDLYFTPDPGDQLSLTMDRSVMSWPTFFQTNYMTGGPMPTWGRHIYYRLTWSKASGEKLEMRWRYKAEFKQGKWSDPFMAYDFTTGLLQVTTPGN